ncbi:MAG: spore germination protein, partial [Clostridia bacterium]|nr:spore germination protein [Clostridia bacterium]
VRSVQEPEKDKAMRGSKDGFVETIVFNTALIRRRIRDTNLCMRMKSVGRASKTDVVVCYMEDRVDQKFLKQLMKKIDRLDVDALTMNQESFAECIFRRKWINPFPKFKYTERPDTAAAHILEGNIIVLVDNAPQAMIMPTSIFDIVDEADDYYFPPVTGTYLRLSRFLIFLLTYFLTPTYLLLTIYPSYIPSSFDFIKITDTINIPIIYQFLILELAIDGLKLAAVNTPNMLSMPLSVMAALVLGEFSVNSGWFNSEVMLYMAFVAVANYTQSNYELGYALKFMRIITLILTAVFGIYGYIGGIILFAVSILTNRTVSNKSYLYPLIPFRAKTVFRQFFRVRLSSTEKK